MVTDREKWRLDEILGRKAVSQLFPIDSIPFVSLTSIFQLPMTLHVLKSGVD